MSPLFEECVDCASDSLLLCEPTTDAGLGGTSGTVVGEGVDTDGARSMAAGVFDGMVSIFSCRAFRPERRRSRTPPTSETLTAASDGFGRPEALTLRRCDETPDTWFDIGALVGARL